MECAIMKKTIITVIGQDTVGIIARVCTYLAENQINILDISQTIVGGYFNMMMVTDATKSPRTHGEIADELAMMEPFGKDNEQPVFMVRGVRAGDGRLIGNGTHIRFSIGEYPCSIGCICFGKAEEYKDMIFGREMIDVVGTIEINEWNGRRSVQMNVKSIGESAVR